MSDLLSAYLPTTLLLGITFSTVFFKAVYFEAALTVNLTNLLVLTTIFISVMQTLPKTAYIKHIDIWLIVCQLVPFAEVLLITAAEALREPGEGGELLTNHHGQIRRVKVAPNSMPASTGRKVEKSVRRWIIFAGSPFP